ncbi:MAG: tRNA 2-selenouridine(34) synthase MnmH [Bacteroidetes bacterium]|nr:MAG: tRNA 2-selenouridine(34) synthase MnmH [Bacteroidota bacterium]
MIHTIDAEEFTKLRSTLPLLDVRSPGEYSQGQIPGAINLPLFTDDERRQTGILYKSAGREAAVLEALGFVGARMQFFVKTARKLAFSKKIMVHCWRGGMRSESMAWLLSTAGLEVFLLSGGYKAYRKYIRDSWNKSANLIVLSGKTGSGKTEILKQIQEKGSQVLDLEKIAHHKGSAFGSIGENPQPSNEQFENNLADTWLEMNFEAPIWVEDESRFIGRVNVPEPLYQQMQKARTICIDIPKSMRIERLILDYAQHPKEMLIESITRIGRRIGGQHLKTAVAAIDKEDFAAAIDIVLSYYDKTYEFDLERKQRNDILHLQCKTADAESNTQLILKHFSAETAISF